MPEEFDWEKIDDYERVTGVVPIDKALVYGDPVGLLREHLMRREREEGREAVLADLTALVDATPPGSPAHDGGAGWLRSYKAGTSAADL
jgi:hypothetical protein